MSLRITDRIIEEAENKRLKNKELAVLFGTTPQFISDCKNGRSNLTDKQVLKFILHNPDLDANYLIHGEKWQQATQSISGNRNYQAGNNITAGNEKLETENNHLKQIIKEKEAQINLLQQLLKK